MKNTSTPAAAVVVVVRGLLAEVRVTVAALEDTRGLTQDQPLGVAEGPGRIVGPTRAGAGGTGATAVTNISGTGVTLGTGSAGAAGTVDGASIAHGGRGGNGGAVVGTGVLSTSNTSGAPLEVGDNLSIHAGQGGNGGLEHSGHDAGSGAKGGNIGNTTSGARLDLTIDTGAGKLGKLSVMGGLVGASTGDSTAGDGGDVLLQLTGGTGDVIGAASYELTTGDLNNLSNSVTTSPSLNGYADVHISSGLAITGDVLITAGVDRSNLNTKAGSFTGFLPNTAYSIISRIDEDVLAGGEYKVTSHFGRVYSETSGTIAAKTIVATAGAADLNVRTKENEIATSGAWHAVTTEVSDGSITSSGKLTKYVDGKVETVNGDVKIETADQSALNGKTGSIDLTVSGRTDTGLGEGIHAGGAGNVEIKTGNVSNTTSKTGALGTGDIELDVMAGGITTETGEINFTTGTATKFGAAATSATSGSIDAKIAGDISSGSTVNYHTGGTSVPVSDGNLGAIKIVLTDDHNAGNTGGVKAVGDITGKTGVTTASRGPLIETVTNSLDHDIDLYDGSIYVKSTQGDETDGSIDYSTGNAVGAGNNARSEAFVREITDGDALAGGKVTLTSGNASGNNVHSGAVSMDIQQGRLVAGDSVELTSGNAPDSNLTSGTTGRTGLVDLYVDQTFETGKNFEATTGNVSEDYQARNTGNITVSIGEGVANASAPSKITAKIGVNLIYETGSLPNGRGTSGNIDSAINGNVLVKGDTEFTTGLGSNNSGAGTTDKAGDITSLVKGDFVSYGNVTNLAQGSVVGGRGRGGDINTTTTGNMYILGDPADPAGTLNDLTYTAGQAGLNADGTNVQGKLKDGSTTERDNVIGKNIGALTTDLSITGGAASATGKGGHADITVGGTGLTVDQWTNEVGLFAGRYDGNQGWKDDWAAIKDGIVITTHNTNTFKDASSRFAAIVNSITLTGGKGEAGNTGIGDDLDGAALLTFVSDGVSIYNHTDIDISTGAGANAGNAGITLKGRDMSGTDLNPWNNNTPLIHSNIYLGGDMSIEATADSNATAFLDKAGRVVFLDLDKDEIGGTRGATLDLVSHDSTGTVKYDAVVTDFSQLNGYRSKDLEQNANITVLANGSTTTKVSLGELRYGRDTNINTEADLFQSGAGSQFSISVTFIKRILKRISTYGSPPWR